MILYPEREVRKIAVTAPSSGAREEDQHLLDEAKASLERKGIQTVIGETARMQREAKSASGEVRAKELMAFLTDSEIDAIVPPWGGELLIEMLEFLDFEQIPRKWIMGYSDISLLLLAVTLNTGIATAHGTNFIDLRGTETDPVTARWFEVLHVKSGQSIEQYSSEKFQESWNHENPTPHVFNMTERTEWKTVSGKPIELEGRLLGGCVDVIRHLIGTPFGDVGAFREKYIPGEPVVWFFENCELAVADFKRTLTQMKYAGWFENCSGILFGRSPANQPTEDYTAEKMMADFAAELDIPVAYDIDCGHQPPQILFVNGAYGKIRVEEGRGTVVQSFI